MKGLARLILFYIPFFLFIVVSGAALAVARAWIGAISTDTPQLIYLLKPITEALPSILAFASYASVLAAFSYASRYSINSLKSILVISLCTAVALTGLVYGNEKLSSSSLRGPAIRGHKLGSPGLILRSDELSVVIIGSPSDPAALRVSARPKAKLKIEKTGSAFGFRNGITASLGLPSPALGGGISDEFTLAGSRLSTVSAFGLIPLLLYAGALASLLASFRFIASMSSWPVANLMLCALIFWGILQFDSFLGSGTVQRFASLFVPKSLAPYLRTLILMATALLVDLYAILRSLSHHRGKHDA